VIDLTVYHTGGAAAGLSVITVPRGSCLNSVPDPVTVCVPAGIDIVPVANAATIVFAVVVLTLTFPVSAVALPENVYVEGGIIADSVLAFKYVTFAVLSIALLDQ
jgi:hypothetical protein